jgi:nucleoside triphosphatase
MTKPRTAQADRNLTPSDHPRSTSKPGVAQVYPEPTVGALIVNNEGKILLAKSHKWFDKYTLPGGHIEVGESMIDAVRREVKEEVGLDVEVVEMLLVQEAIFAPEFYKKKHFVFIDFYCKSKDQQVKLDQNEIQDYIWVYPGAAYNLKLDSFTRKTLDRYLERGRGSSYGSVL